MKISVWYVLGATIPLLSPSLAKCAAKDPFAVIDPQHWVNPDAMTWSDFRPAPNTSWNDPSRKGFGRNFNIALIAVDYDDKNFTVTTAPYSDIFGNPSPQAANIPRDKVATFFRDMLNTPSELNRGHTMHEYWMQDSAGRFGVDLAPFGPYRMPSLAYQYGIENGFNPGACPQGKECDQDLRRDAIGRWRSEVGNDTADAYELVFILSAGQDESSTWQEFGEMKFASKDDVPAEFGPPSDSNLTNSAKTRYVPWTSWASASSIWPNAGGGSSLQCESSGMGTFAHELSHLLKIGDNYNNPYGEPPRRSYTGPWSMMSRGSFNGPGGPHTRWQIPPLQGASLGSLHTVRDKLKIGLITEDKLIKVSRDALKASGPVVARVTARSVESDVMGLRVVLGKDDSPPCHVNADPFCDGGGWDNYDMEVVDRMGADSFQADAGVLISKTKEAGAQPFQWVVDANPDDIGLVDFVRPNGTKAMVTIGDYRQLLDALFHAGTRSGSEFEHKDEANKIHLYVLGVHRSKTGVLSYTVGARHMESISQSKHGVSLSKGRVRGNKPTEKGVVCSFNLTNNGNYIAGNTAGIDKYFRSGIYRLQANVKGRGWRVAVPNELVVAEFGSSVRAEVAVGATKDADKLGVVTLTAASESDASVKAVAECKVQKHT